MSLTEFLTPSMIFIDVVVSSKKRALELVGKIIAESLNQMGENEGEQCVCPVGCFECLFKREKLGSTSLGNGVALPHAKLPNTIKLNIDKPIAVFLKLETPIDYEVTDNKAVDLIYGIMFPEHTCGQYQDHLNKIAQMLSDKNNLKLLRVAETAEEIWQALEYIDKRG